MYNGYGINSPVIVVLNDCGFILYHVHFSYARVQGVIFGSWHVRSYCWPMSALVCYGRTVPVPASTHRAGILLEILKPTRSPMAKVTTKTHNNFYLSILTAMVNFISG